MGSLSSLVPVQALPSCPLREFFRFFFARKKTFRDKSPEHIDLSEAALLQRTVLKELYV